MKVIDNLLAMVGATPGRKAKPPTYRAIADGLIITATKAEAWFEIPTANTDTMPELLLDDEVQSVIRVAGRALKDADCHLKVIWSSLEGTEYVRGIEGEYTAGNWRRWVDMRAEQIDAMQLPQRHVLLGVTIAEGTKHDTSGVQQLAAPAFGIEQHRVRESDMSRYANVAFKLGRQLRVTARLALNPGPALAHFVPGDRAALAAGAERPQCVLLPHPPLGRLHELEDPHRPALVPGPQRHTERGGGFALAGPGVHDHQRPAAPRARVEIGMGAQHLVDLAPDRHDGVERGHRLLEDHRHPRGAELPQPVLARGQQLLADQLDAAGGRRQRALLQQPHHRQRGDGFARAALADHA